MIGHNKLVCYITLDLKWLTGVNMLAYWAHSYITKKMKCRECGPRFSLFHKTNYDLIKRFTITIGVGCLITVIKGLAFWTNKRSEIFWLNLWKFIDADRDGYILVRLVEDYSYPSMEILFRDPSYCFLQHDIVCIATNRCYCFHVSLMPGSQSRANVIKLFPSVLY